MNEEEINQTKYLVKSVINRGNITEIESYLTPEAIKKYGIKYEIKDLIIATGNIDKYLTKEKIKELNITNLTLYKLIIATGNIDKYLTKEKIDELNLKVGAIVYIITKSGKTIDSYLTKEKIEELNISQTMLRDLIIATRNIDRYLTKGKISELGLDSFFVYKLIVATGNIEKYLTKEKIKELGITNYYICELIAATGNIEKYLTKEKIEELGIDNIDITMLINKTGKIEEYLTEEKIKELGLNGSSIIFLIFQTGKLEKYITAEAIKKYQLDIQEIKEIFRSEIKYKEKMNKYLSKDLIHLLELSKYEIGELLVGTGKLEEFLTKEKIQEYGFDIFTVEYLIEKTNNIERYLTKEKIQELGLDTESVVKLIAKTKNVNKYLTREKIQEYGFEHDTVIKLIKKAYKNMDKYLTKEKIEELKLSYEDIAEILDCFCFFTDKGFGEVCTEENFKKWGWNNNDIIEVAIIFNTIESYLTKDAIKKYNFTTENISKLMLALDSGFKQIIDREMANGTYNEQKILHILNIYQELKNSNSEKLSRIAVEITLQIQQLPLSEQKVAIEKIKNIYENKNLPECAKNFQVFETLHPNFMGEENAKLYSDRSYGEVPSLKEATPLQRKHIIFSDLLRIAIESNSRDLRDYINIIEKGNNLYKTLKENGSIEKIDLEDKQVLKRYSDILNALYNQTSKAKRSGKTRENSGDILNDLTELEKLLKEDDKIKMDLPDRIVRMFGYWAGIRNFEQAKNMILEIPQIADQKNRRAVINGKLTYEKGDFVKGIEMTEYFPRMLQNGIVAKEYLGNDASSDCTPLDTDVEMISEDKKMRTAFAYTDEETSGKKLGKIILVIKNDGTYIQTREGEKTNDEAVNDVLNGNNKKEYFDNNGVGGENAYGIRTGIGSTNISYIIADKYVDKLGLEIAINGFYIPIVDMEGKVIFTPEMYDKIRERMQGLSYYGINEFKVDETAVNKGTTQIVELIDENKKQVSNKKKLILQTLKSAIEQSGLRLSTNREQDLEEGIVEVLDTGSTGRETNEPGDGDFDFMVRLDKKVLESPEEFKENLQRVLHSVSNPQKVDITGNGDFRYKGVSIQGLEGKVDLDLTFVQRTDQIEYTTEESIKDRLETIKRISPDRYKYVIANILLAKKVLKTKGVYKKETSEAPTQGQIDTRGGLGAVGIENWILQNGGSFEKAAKEFLRVSKECSSFEEFQQKYPIWDFGENYMAGNMYPHDNFVYNMTEDGYQKMQKALEEYQRTVEAERESEAMIGLGDIVQQDMEAINDTLYMRSVSDLLKKARQCQTTR